MVLRFLDAGESHGRCLLGIIEGFPYGFSLSEENINRELGRRQGGYGRGDRMQIEQDRITILSGLISGKTIGSPLGLMIKNKDWDNQNPDNQTILMVPRPGHADLAGVFKYGLNDYRPILERASARKTAMRVAIGSIGEQLLEHFSITSYGHVLRIGNKKVQQQRVDRIKEKENTAKIKDIVDCSPVYCLDSDISRQMCHEIDQAKKEGNTLGGQFEIVARNIPPGLGSHVFWDRKIDARIAGALMSIPSVKAVEIGEGIKSSARRGSRVQDPIYLRKEENNQLNQTRYYHRKNWAGGIEGGITNGEEIIVRAYVKPVPTLLKPLASVDLHTKKETIADYQRSDTCVVPAASVVGKAVMDWEIACAFLEKFAGDSLEQIEANYKGYLERIRNC
ncbi:MAG: chorismate synthase [Candidatus Cloacimonas sp. SDB]|nr:MAG: chorismate synthase [Candidatus Cloacimonas sp. SDB]